MMQIDEILDDLNTRKKNLAKLKKEISGDKTKSGIADSVDELIKKVTPLVTETARLAEVRKKMKTFSADVDKLNGSRKMLINSFNTLKKSCDSVKDDTKAKDFDAISKDADAYVALNDFEKL